MGSREARPPLEAQARGYMGEGGQRGFTLLEMMVALAVFSLAALALIKLQGFTIRTAADLDGKVMAGIVAHNLMVDVQTAPTAPSRGEDQGEVENGGKNWRWTRTVTPMDDERFVRVDVAVTGPAGEAPAALSFVRVTE